MSQPATASAPATGLRLHLGCGHERREGWIDVDVNPRFQPDVVAPAHDLGMFADGSCAQIESCHLLEHLTLAEARAALREWRRLLAPGGELLLELPNLERCLQLVGTELDGHDLGLISLFGYPPEVDEQGVPQMHKWGWTPDSLSAELRAAGFERVRAVPITQTHRPAARFERDMRLVATVGAPADAAGTAQPARPAATPVAGVEAPGSPAAPDAQAADAQVVLAWPRYDDPAGLEHFFHVFARVLSGREDVRLLLRLDPELDPPREQAVAALEQAHRDALGADTPVDLTLLEGALAPEEWRELGQGVACRIRSTSDAPPRDAARQCAAPVVADAAGLFGVLTGGSCAAPGEEAPAAAMDGLGVEVPPGQAPDPALLRRIRALHPWFYPVRMDGLTVTPGVGSVCSPEWLASRAACRATLLVDGVLQRVEFSGRSVLDLACNCGFWSSHYAAAGAASVLGIEGRPQHVEQARLYWERNGFLPDGAWEFVEGDVADEADWGPVRARAPFDVTLCAGILYHVPNYADVLRWAAAVTKDVLIVDTRVQDGAEERVTEPGDLAFNAIAATREKVVPNRARLLATLQDLGFEPEVLPVGFGTEPGVDNVDSYAEGARVTIVARKVPAPLRASVEAPQSASTMLGGRG